MMAFFSTTEKMDEQVGLSSNILKLFTGEGDVVAWLYKLKLVTKLQKIEDVAKLMYLEENSLAVYLEIGEKDQADAVSIEKILKTAFLEDAIEAYIKLRKVTLTVEPVDGYGRRIVEKTVKMAFVSGFPGRISIELQRLASIEHGVRETFEACQGAGETNRCTGSSCNLY